MGKGTEQKREKRNGAICFYATGLAGIMALLFAAAFYWNCRLERLESAREAAQSSAAILAAGLDGYLAASGAGPEEWDKWLAGYGDLGDGVVVADGTDSIVFSSGDGLEEAALELLGTEKNGRKVRGGNDGHVAALEESRLSEYRFVVFCGPSRRGDGIDFPSLLPLGMALAMGIACAAACGLRRYVRKLEESSVLQSSVLQKQDAFQKLLELQMIRGETIPVSGETEFLEQYVLADGRLYAVAVVVLEPADEERQEEMEELAVCEKILAAMPEELRELACLPPVCGFCSITAVLSGEDEVTLAGRVRAYYEGMRTAAAAVSGQRILAGVSAWKRDPARFHEAYRESVDAIVNSEEKERSKAFAPDLSGCFILQPGLEFSNTLYDAVYEERLRTGIRNMEREQCCSAAEDFVRYLAREGYSQDRLLLYILRFANALFLAAQQLNVDLKPLYPEGLHRVYEELLEVPEPGRVKRYMVKRLIDPILEARGRLLERKSYFMLEEIEDLIRARRGNLSIQECAELLDVHPTYIWKLIKAENGKTFSDFLERYKLDEAKRLLTETDMTVAEISAELNYTNAQNFIRFFSKNTGVTPGKYRKQSLEEKL